MTDEGTAGDSLSVDIPPGSQLNGVDHVADVQFLLHPLYDPVAGSAELRPHLLDDLPDDRRLEFAFKMRYRIRQQASRDSVRLGARQTRTSETAERYVYRRVRA